MQKGHLNVQAGIVDVTMNDVGISRMRTPRFPFVKECTRQIGIEAITSSKNSRGIISLSILVLLVVSRLGTINR